MKKALITGISGFVGGYLAEHLLSLQDFEVYGSYHSETSISSLSSIKDSLHLFQVDMSEKDAVGNLVANLRPAYIFHLAALTSPAESMKNPGATINTNINAEINLLEALRNNNLTDTRCLIVSSAEIYGQVAESDLPIDEETSFKPLSPYAVSKIAQDYLGLQYFLAYNLPVIRVRPFNHVGPKQSEKFVLSSFAKQIAEIEKGGKEPVMKVGNLEAKKDFTDVRDMVRAYSMVIEKGISGDVYNIGSGKSYKIADMLQTLLSFSHIKITVEQDPLLVRKTDVKEYVCDNTKIQSITGWKPEIPFDTTMKDTLDYWRALV